MASNPSAASSSRDAQVSRGHAARPTTRKRRLRLVAGEGRAPLGDSCPPHVVRPSRAPKLNADAACVLARIIQRALSGARQDAGRGGHEHE